MMLRIASPSHHRPPTTLIATSCWPACLPKRKNTTVTPPPLRDVTLIARIPNHKADFNNNGPVSTDYIGKSWAYPNASYVLRQEIWNDHINYTKGFFYFLVHDARVPKSLREEA